MRLPLLLLAVGLAALVGCDEEIAAPDALGAYYTLWGALDPTSALQAVRVIPIEDQPGGADPAPLDAAMTSEDLETGAVAAWRDSVVTYADGTVGHVFVADTEVRYGATYRVTVTRGDGATTAANVRVPPLVLPYRQATTISLDGVFMPVLWQGAPQLNRLAVTYRLQDATCRAFDYAVDFEGEAEPYEFGWTTTLDLRDDAARVLSALGDAPHTVLSVTLAGEVASDEWRPPEGVFDPEVLVEPGLFSNVEQGFGFVGGAYEAALTWTPEAAAITAAGFEPPGFCR
jgi:hypothetical protein